MLAGAAGEEIVGERLLRVWRLVTFGSRLCASTADSLAAMMGVTGQKASNPVQRLYRDCRDCSHAHRAQLGSNHCPHRQGCCSAFPPETR